MDENGFHKNEKPNEYEAGFSIRGEVRVSIKADSLEEAKSKALEMLEDDEFGHELDEIHDIDIDHVWKSRAMFLVTRDGQKMQVSHIDPRDVPREPDERGF